MKAAFGSDYVGPPSRLIPVPHVRLTLPELPDHPLFREIIRQLGLEESRRMYGMKMDKPYIKAAEDGLSFAFQIDSEESVTYGILRYIILDVLNQFGPTCRIRRTI